MWFCVQWILALFPKGYTASACLAAGNALPCALLNRSASIALKNFNPDLFPSSLISKRQLSTGLWFRNEMKSRCFCAEHCRALYDRRETSWNNIIQGGNSWLWPSSQKLWKTLLWVWWCFLKLEEIGNKMKPWKKSQKLEGSGFKFLPSVCYVFKTEPFSQWQQHVFSKNCASWHSSVPQRERRKM